ncbi:MAG: replication endonuclease [Methylobacter sp.]|nr:replication endonuclease [Methylobacter sp.]
MSLKNRPLSKKRARKQAQFHIQQIESCFDSKILVKTYLDSVGIDPPKCSNDESFFLRLVCVDWWARKLITKDIRDREAAAIFAGKVAKGRELYCSNDTVDYIRERWDDTLAGMAQKMCVSDCGDELDMLDIMKSSLANPENRRAELMVRMSGFEQYADDLGDIGMFYTLTCPSKYHRFAGSDLIPNKNYNGATPKQAQHYLTKIWSQIRAELDRHHIKPYGFRVAEPHHDGTPHWHILLFMNPADEAVVTATLNKYALKEDGQEKGAAVHRFTAKKIVKEIVTKDGIKKVSATGYIAKYIAKNIGFDIGMDSEDDSQNTESSANRVRAWSSTWGIRQFQQIGGASVIVWRELRRLKDKDIEHDVIRSARDCCINNDWAGFLVVMGGNDVKRIERELQLLKQAAFDPETGEVRLNRYQEIVLKVVGIAAAATEIITHTKVWTIVQKPTSVHSASAVEGGGLPPPSTALAALEFYK